jgi:hypothetical protein
MTQNGIFQGFGKLLISVALGVNGMTERLCLITAVKGFRDNENNLGIHRFSFRLAPVAILET